WPRTLPTASACSFARPGRGKRWIQATWRSPRHWPSATRRSRTATTSRESRGCGGAISSAPWRRYGSWSRWILSGCAGRRCGAGVAGRWGALYSEILSLRYQGRLREALAVARMLRASDAASAASPSGPPYEAGLLEAEVLFEMGHPRAAAALFDSLAIFAAEWREPSRV